MVWLAALLAYPSREEGGNFLVQITFTCLPSRRGRGGGSTPCGDIPPVSSGLFCEGLNRSDLKLLRLFRSGSRIMLFRSSFFDKIWIIYAVLNSQIFHWFPFFDGHIFVRHLQTFNSMLMNTVKLLWAEWTKVATHFFQNGYEPNEFLNSVLYI